MWGCFMHSNVFQSFMAHGKGFMLKSSLVLYYDNLILIAMAIAKNDFASYNMSQIF